MSDFGAKRSVIDRLGGNVNNTTKRQRYDDNGSSSSHNAVNDMCIDKADLRYKIMQKCGTARPQSDVGPRVVDLREKLSKMKQSQTVTLNDLPGVLEPSQISILGKHPLSRSIDNLPQMGSVKNSYPVWTLDQLRQNPEDIVRRSSTSIPHQRKDRDVVNTHSIRSKDDSRSINYTIEGIAPKTLYPAGYQTTVEKFLDSLGLAKYAILLKAEEVDLTILKRMRENDLQELGLPMGPRKTILLALHPR